MWSKSSTAGAAAAGASTAGASTAGAAAAGTTAASPAKTSHPRDEDIHQTIFLRLSIHGAATPKEAEATPSAAARPCWGVGVNHRGGFPTVIVSRGQLGDRGANIVLWAGKDGACHQHD
ncbi:MAG TPA: hypothetical protein VN765_02510 [Candidatus Acidoferrum sp.]|nr:hypothetical protein [Candidatus Acidoferrum sp.]